MKLILSESQYRRLIETKEEPKILRFPSLEFFDKGQLRAWHMLQRILNTKSNRLFSIDGELVLPRIDQELLGNLGVLNNLVSIKHLNLGGLPIKELNSLVRVEENLLLNETLIESLPNLEYVGGLLDLQNTPIESLPKLKYVDGILDLAYTKIKNIDGLENVYSIYLIGTPIKSLGNVKTLPGTLNLNESEIEDLGRLESVGRNLFLRYSSIKSLGNLQYVGRDLDLGETKINSLGKLKQVGNDLNLYGTPLSDRMTREEILEIVDVKGDIYM